MKCLVLPFSYFGAARLSLAWLKISCPTLSQLWARKVDEKWQRDSPAFCAGLSHSPRLAGWEDCRAWAVAGSSAYSRQRGLQGMGSTRQLCLQQAELAADSLPPSQPPRQHLSSGTNGGVGRRLLCCWRLCEFCWVESWELAYWTAQKGVGLPIWLIGDTDILDTLCWDCSQTSLVRPYPLARPILRTSFSIVAVLLKD